MSVYRNRNCRKEDNVDDVMIRADEVIIINENQKRCCNQTSPSRDCNSQRRPVINADQVVVRTNNVRGAEEQNNNHRKCSRCGGWF
ncbi:hypothetical protein [Oceanobacillus massiliensis]|uniref:hypothetical protein n=1 Tax=Oceanobacillus massiliensis TaxID=1465765 RepID=UPI000288895E|nr:hypothetical protein [Oceanobacillus massiliensis]